MVFDCFPPPLHNSIFVATDSVEIDGKNNWLKAYIWESDVTNNSKTPLSLFGASQVWKHASKQVPASSHATQCLGRTSGPYTGVLTGVRV